MNLSAAFAGGKRVWRTFVQVILFPLDWIRMSLFFLHLTVRWTGQTYERLITGVRTRPVEFYICKPMRSDFVWDDKLRFVVSRPLTFYLLRALCGCPHLALADIGMEAKPSSRISLMMKQHVRMGMGLGVIWALLAGGAAVTWKVAAHFNRSWDLAAGFQRDADRLYAQGAFAQARIQYLNAIQQHPGHVAAQWGLAQSALQLDRLPEARKALERVVSIDESHRMARLALIDLLLRQGQAVAALEHASWSIKKDPGDVEALVRLGKCQQLLGHRSEARQQAEAALRRSPDHAGALLLAAATAADDGDCPSAHQCVDRAIKVVPEAELDRLVVARILGKCGGYAPALVQLDKLLAQEPANWVAAQERAELLLAAGDMNEAIRSYQKLAQIVPANASIQIRLAELLLAAGRLDEAHAAGESMVRKTSLSEAGHMVLATVYYLKGLWSASASHCQLLLELAPTSVPARTLLARVLMRQGHYRQAAVWLQPMGPEDRRNQEIRLMLAECHVEQGNRKAAFDLLEEIQNMNPASEAPHLLLARLHMAAGEQEKAIAACRKALELNPRQPVALNNLAALLSSGEPGKEQQRLEAQQLATEAWSLRPDNPEITETLGWIQALRGEYASAISLLTYSARLLPLQPQIRYHLAYALAGLNRLDDASRELDRAVELSPALARRQEFRDLQKRIEAEWAARRAGP